MLSYLSNKKLTLSLGIVAVLCGLSFSLSSISTKVDELARLEGGLNTCFLRVNQTYTGSLLGNKTSPYISQEFQRMSEECFAETLVQAEDFSNKSFDKIVSLINSLTSEVNWFHQNLDPRAALIPSKTKDMREAGERFRKIEDIVNNALTRLEQVRATEIDRLFNYKLTLFLLSVILFSILYSEVKSKTEKQEELSILEHDAVEETTQRKEFNVQRARQIIGEALLANGLNHCKELFSNLSVVKDEDPVDKKPVHEIKIPQKLILKKETEVVEEKVTKKMNLSQAISSVIEKVSSQLFTQGIILDLDLKDKINILGKREQVELFLFHLFKSYCNAFEETQGDKKIIAKVKRLGRTVLLDVEAVGEIGAMETNIDYNIVKEIINDLEGSLSFEEVLTHGGLKTRLQFRYVGETKKSNLVTLKKGSKKQVLQEIQNKRFENAL